MWLKCSSVPGHLVLELVGPLVDDGGEVARALGAVLTDRGVELRPGALDQVAGGTADWALNTLLEGHGRTEMLRDAHALHEELLDRWRRAAARARAAHGAVEQWRRLAAGADQVGVLSVLPPDISRALAAAAGFGDLDPHWIDASMDGGPPRSELLREAMWDWLVPADRVTAVVATVPALLAAHSARCGEVLLVGEGTPQAALLAERRVASLAEVG